METEAPSQEKDANGGLSAGDISAIVIGITGIILTIITIWFGTGHYYRRREKKRCERCNHGGTTDQGPGSTELGATEHAGVNESLLNTTSSQAARVSTGVGATESEGNVTEVDQRPNHQGEINGSSEGCGDEQAAEAEDGVDNIDASQSSVSPAEQTAEAEDRVDNMEASQSSVSPAEQAAEVLTNEYFMDLAKEIGSEWEFLAFSLEFTKPEVERIMEEKRQVIYRTLHVLQCWMERTKIKDKREKVKFLCKALTKCGRRELSEQVKSDAGFGS